MASGTELAAAAPAPTRPFVRFRDRPAVLLERGAHLLARVIVVVDDQQPPGDGTAERVAARR